MDRPRPPQHEAARRTAYEENAEAADAPHGPSRELYWEECGIEQKVERVREALLRMEHLLEVMGKRSTEAVSIAKLHDHNEHGVVMMPAMPPYGAMNEVEMNVRGIFYRLHSEQPHHGATIAGSLLKG